MSKRHDIERIERIVIFTFLFTLWFFELVAQSKKQFIKDVQDYQNSVKLKQWKTDDNITEKMCFDIDTNTFSLSAYLSYFNKLRLPENATPDYIFMDNFLDGSPILFTVKDHSDFQDFYKRREKENFHENDTANLTEDFSSSHKRAALIGFASDSLNNLRFNITPESSKTGFVQFLFMNIHGESFALKWHSNYGISHVITSKKELKKYFEKYHEKIFEIGKSGLDSLMKQKPTLKIRMKKEKCMITWYEFAPFSGYMQFIYSIERFAPYKVNLEKKKLLIGVTPTIIF